MMMSEFIERTGYEPDAQEYRQIEESYYDFDGNKDEFCKQWLKDKRNGAWDKEYKLRLALEAAREETKQAQAQAQEYADELNATAGGLIEARAEIKCLKAENEQLTGMIGLEINLTLKTGEQINKRVKEVRYINSSGFCFINVIEESGWTQSYKIDDIERFNIA